MIPAPHRPATVAAIDRLPAPDAAAVLAPLFEGAPGFLFRLVAARPFRTWDGLFGRARALAHQMPEPLQVELVDAHPRLGAPREVLSAMSAVEQGPAPAAESLAERLERLNADYEARFGFRYCVFVAGRPLAALIPELEAARSADRDAELHRALDAVVDIARARSRRTASRATTAPAGDEARA